MEDPKWLLSLVVARLDEAACRDLIAKADQEVVAAMIEDMPFSRVPNDILCKILSFTPRADTLKVMCVCKKWYQQTRKPLFWMPRIEAVKETTVRARGGSRQEEWFKVIPAFLTFDTFASPVKETLQDQLQWLWKPELVRFGCTGETARLYRRTVRDTVYEEQRCLSDNTVTGRVWFKSTTTDYDKEMVAVFGEMYALRRLEVETHRAAIARHIARHTRYGVFEGQGLLLQAKGSSQKMYLPHGNGKWTFKDGSILEGEMVACKGEPRYLVPQPPVEAKSRAEAEAEPEAKRVKVSE